MPRQQQNSGKAIQTRPSVPQQPFPFVPTRTNTTSSLGQTVKEGFSFGLGSAIAHKLVGSFFGSTTNAVHPIVASDATNSQKSTDPVVQTARSIGASATQDMSGQIDYLQCMKEGGTEDACKQYLA
jgi:hypothetical protein